MLSRILGFVREALMAAVLGAGPVADAFFAAFRLPNFFRRFFAEGAFNSAFVPMFGERLEQGGRSEAEHFASSILSVLILTLLTLTLLAEIFMGAIVRNVIAPAFDSDPAKLELTIHLARIMFPYIAFVSLMAMMAGILNSFRRYFLAALAPVLLNVVLVASLIVAFVFETPPATIGVYLSIGVLVGGVAQLGLVYWAVRRENFKFTFMRPSMTPQVKTFLLLAAPTALANGIVQVNLLVGQAIASAQAGAISLLQYADRLYQLPLGVIGIAIGVVLLPELTRVLAAGDNKEGNRLMDRSVEFALLLILPASIGLFILSDSITALLYERGAFSRETTLGVSAALKAFAVGLPAFMLIKIFVPAFFARKDTRTPMWLAGLNAALNIVGSLTLFPVYGHVGIAIATAAASWVNALALLIVLWMRCLYVPSTITIKRVAYINAAGLILASGALAALWFGGDVLLNAGLLTRAVCLLGLIGALALVYFVFLHVCGAFPLGMVKGQFQRRKAHSDSD